MTRESIDPPRPLADLRALLSLLRREGELVELECEVDPDLEAAEVHRRVIAAGGPALLFKRIKGSPWPLVTNLFGTRRRVELAFGSRPLQVMRRAVEFAQGSMPPKLSTLWRERDILGAFAKAARSRGKRGSQVVAETTPGLSRLPLLRTWAEDGGPFVTLPLVLTADPEGRTTNLGVYRVQRYSDDRVGLHVQIGKGGGFHLAAHEDRGLAMPVNIHIGGPPALLLGAVAPLPENVPELLLAALVQGEGIALQEHALARLPYLSPCELTIVGEVAPGARHPEGPFGDHYGYYSLQHPYPLVQVKALLRRSDPICTATVVGKPRQEDFFLGDFLQELLTPLIRLVMPTVADLWSYGETGYHSLAAAVVRQRYKREAMVSAFRILGEGQLALTKFLLLTDRPVELRDFTKTLEHVLARARFETDLYVLGNLSMDTLDYTGPSVNEGSKGVLLGLGDAVRELPGVFSGALPSGFRSAVPFCKGCLCVDGPGHAAEPGAPQRLAQAEALASWPLVVLCDDAAKTAQSPIRFLWTTFTRFEPAADLHSKAMRVVRHQPSYTAPIVIDARMKASYPKELFTDEATKRLVSRRWREYFPGGADMGDSDAANLG
jgi:UbiD family decarboxylase